MTNTKIKAILSSIENNCFESRFMNSGFSDKDITEYGDELITVTNDDMNEARKDRFKNYEKFFRNYNTNIPTFEIKIPRRDLWIFKNIVTRYSEYFQLFTICLDYGVKDWNDIKCISYSKNPVIDILQICHAFTEEECQRLLEVIGNHMSFYSHLKGKYIIPNFRKILNDKNITDPYLFGSLIKTSWAYFNSDAYGDFSILRDSKYTTEVLRIYFNEYGYYKAYFPDITEFVHNFPVNINPIYIKLYAIIDRYVYDVNKHTPDSLYYWKDYSIEAATLIVDKYNQYIELFGPDDGDPDFYSFEKLGEIIRSIYSIERMKALFDVYDFREYREDIIWNINESNCPVDVINEIAHCQDDVIDKLVEYWEIFTNNPTVEDIKAFRLYGDDNYEVDFPHGFNAENFINWYNEKGEMKNV